MSSYRHKWRFVPLRPSSVRCTIGVTMKTKVRHWAIRRCRELLFRTSLATILMFAGQTEAQDPSQQYQEGYQDGAVFMLCELVQMGLLSVSIGDLVPENQAEKTILQKAESECGVLPPDEGAAAHRVQTEREEASQRQTTLPVARPSCGELRRRVSALVTEIDRELQRQAEHEQLSAVARAINPSVPSMPMFPPPRSMAGEYAALAAVTAELVRQCPDTPP